MTLSNQSAKDYIEHSGVRCPHCGDENIEGGFIEINAGQARQPISCNACGAKWTDVYRLDHIEEGGD